jgi:agmatinase
MQIIRVKLKNADIEKSCDKSPVEILKELKNIEFSEKKKKIDFENLSLEEIHVDLEDISEANHLIFENSKEIFEKNEKAFFIGGDDSINFPILNAFNKIQEDAFLLVFDAFVDVNEKDNDRGWIRQLIKKGFKLRNLLLVSSREFSEKELDFILENEIQIISMDLLQENLEESCDLIMERARNSGGFFVGLDVSCLDPAFAPASSYLSPGGLSSRELIYLIKRLALLKNFRGASITEINPDRDFGNVTLKIGARLLAEMI